MSQISQSSFASTPLQGPYPGSLRLLVVFLALMSTGLERALGQDAQGASQESVTRQELNSELEAVRARLRELEERLGSVDRGGAPHSPPGESSTSARPGEAVDGAGFSPFYDRENLETPRNLRTIYDKPFLASLWRRAHLGGYTEFEYHEFENRVLGVPEGFRMHRTNLFLFADVSDRVRFASEFEFETEFEDDGPSDEIETKVEMAFVDWLLYEELKVRAGALLVPLGRVNVNHDGPVRHLTDRPMVSTFIIPTTLTEAGAGIHGTFSFPGNSGIGLTYETYAVNGFNILDENGELSADITEPEQVLREGRSSNGGDVNAGVASTGRVALQVAQQLEIGGSWHIGTYDEDGENFLRIFAGDLAWSRAFAGVEFEIEGEIAVADFQRDGFARTAGVPDRFWGYYVQGAVGGMPRWLRQGAPAVFGDAGASLGGVLRYEWVDLDGDRGEAFEPGVTFRPVADTVFKASYRIPQRSLGLGGLPGRDDDEGFVFSVSSYF